MKRIIAVVLAVLVLTIAFAVPTFAQTPNDNSSQVAWCATQMGGQHVANCAQTMEDGVSTCAQTTGPCVH